MISAVVFQDRPLTIRKQNSYLNGESAEGWAREIRSQALRQNTLQELLKTGR